MPFKTKFSSGKLSNQVSLFWEKARSSIIMATRSLWLHKLRAFLSVLGIIIGTTAVISLMAFGEGNMQDALNDIKRQGATNIILRSVKPPDKANVSNKSFFVNYGLTEMDYEGLDYIPTIIRKVPMRIFMQEVRTPGRMVLGRVVATTKEYQLVNKFEMQAGRFLIDADNELDYGDDKELRNVCVLGSNMALELFPFENPVGKTVTINKHRYVVIGIVAERMATGSSGGGGGEEFNEDVYIPYDTCMALFGKKIYLRQSGTRSGEVVEYHQITVSVSEMSEVRDTGAALKKMLERHHEDKQDWAMAIPLDRLEEAERARDRYQVLLFFIAFISLLVGGIGIMNIMLATVTERTREIGIRRALGAKRKDIILQFMVEAVMQTTIGGLLGVVLGLVIIFGIPLVALYFFSAVLPAQLRYDSIFYSLVVTLVVGVAFGLYPAWRASRLDPIEALRHN